MDQPASRTIGVPVIELRLIELDQTRRDQPYALAVGVSDTGQVQEIAAGSRREMKNLRNYLIIAMRTSRGPLESLASALAPLIAKFPIEAQ